MHAHFFDLVRGDGILYRQKEGDDMIKKAKILTDSTCDMSSEDCAALGVTVLPLSVIFGDDVYRQGIDLSVAEFYEKLAVSHNTPKTAQVSYYDFSEAYKALTADGSEVVSIHISSGLSGTYQSAVMAANDNPGVYCIDSQTATFALALLVREAVKLRDEGKSAREIADAVTALTKRVRLLAYVPTLKYLVRGGRMSALAGTFGTVLNICPILTVQDGLVKSLGKARGVTRSIKEILRRAAETGIDKVHCVVFGHTNGRSGLDALKSAFSDLLSGCQGFDCDIGAVIGAHAGPGAAGVAFIEAEV
jgi:DegV family protein with EDD domain